MRIGIFSECYHPTINGVVVSIDTFKEELEKKGHEYFIFAPETKGYHDKKGEYVCRYPSIVWPGEKNYPIGLPILAPSVFEKIKELNLDIIHVQHMFDVGRTGLLVARRLDIPVVYTYHTLLTEYTHYVPVLRSLAKRIIIGMSRRFCNQCDQVITPSDSMKKILESYNVRAPIEVIPTGIDIEKYNNPMSREEIEQKWGVSKNKKLLLYLSRIAKEKNIDFLFRVIQKLNEKRKDFHLLMVGGGPELEHYKEKAKSMSLDGVITFTDMQPKEVVVKIFGAADVFVFPSITETQGIVIAEAMAAGTPAVAVNKMGPSDIIKNGEDGFLVSMRVDDFLEKVELLLNNHELREKMSNVSKTNAQIYSDKSCADKMELLYQQVIKRHTIALKSE